MASDARMAYRRPSIPARASTRERSIEPSMPDQQWRDRAGWSDPQRLALAGAAGEGLRATLALIGGYGQSLLHLALDDDARRRCSEGLLAAADSLAELTDRILELALSRDGSPQTASSSRRRGLARRPPRAPCSRDGRRRGRPVPRHHGAPVRRRRSAVDRSCAPPARCSRPPTGWPGHCGRDPCPRRRCDGHPRHRDRGTAGRPAGRHACHRGRASCRERASADRGRGARALPVDRGGEWRRALARSRR